MWSDFSFLKSFTASEKAFRLLITAHIHSALATGQLGEKKGVKVTGLLVMQGASENKLFTTQLIVHNTVHIYLLLINESK